MYTSKQGRDSSMHDIDTLVGMLAPIVQDGIAHHSGRAVHVYLDTADVWRALMGKDAYALDSRGRTILNTKEFGKPGVIASSLLAAGMIEEVRMLPPHQAEFLRRLEPRAQIAAGDPVPILPRKELLARLGKIGKALQTDRLRELNDAQFAAWLRKGKYRIEDLFKVVHCIDKLWLDRLDQWLRKSIVVFPAADNLSDSITSTPVFARVLQAFTARRAGDRYRINNFADAVAVAVLAQMCARRRQSDLEPIPRFVDTSGLFLQVVKDAEVSADLEVVEGDIRTSSVVPIDYLRVRTSFAPRRGLVKYGDVQAVYNELITVGKLETPERQSAMREIRLVLKSNKVARSLADIADDFVSFGFLRRMWLAETDEKELRSILLRSAGVENADLLDVSERIGKLVETVRRKLTANVSRFTELNAKWDLLRIGITRRCAEYAKTPQSDQRAFLFTRCGLVRFAIKSPLSHRLDQLFVGMYDRFQNGQDIAESAEWLAAARHALATEDQATPKTSAEDSLVGPCVMWMARMYDALADRKPPPYAHETRVLLHAAALIERRTASALHGARATIAELDRQASALVESPDKQSQARATDLLSGLAYLSYRLSIAEGEMVGAEGSEASDRLGLRSPRLKAAIAYAERGLALARSAQAGSRDPDWHRELRYTYLVNQALFYLVEQADRGTQRQIASLAGELLRRQRFAADTWGYTYYDTISRQWRLLAQWADDGNLRVSYLQNAVAMSDRAVPNETDDPIVIANHSTVTFELLEARGAVTAGQRLRTRRGKTK